MSRQIQNRIMASREQKAKKGTKRQRKKGGGAPRRRASQPQEHFYIQHTDNDMMLIISDQGDGGFSTTRRVRRMTEPASSGNAPTTDSGWGETMPLEILHRVFQLLAESEGAVPTLCRLSRVCRRWCQVASSPSLWRRVSLGFCWVEPGKKIPPKTQTKVQDTVQKLIKDRLSLLSDFSLHHWKQQVPFVVKELSLHCPQLSTLTLSHCHGVSLDALLSVAQNCPQLVSLNLQNSQVESSALLRFLDECGFRLQHLFLTLSNQTKAVMSRLAVGSCPELRLLEVNTEIKQGGSDLPVCIESLQVGCPKLEVLRLLNLVCSPKSLNRRLADLPGFVDLQELCLATSTYSLVNDSTCKRLLRDSSKLKVLDLRGCLKVTPQGICDLPCTDLERLYLGMYWSTNNLALPSAGSVLLVRRWQHSLRDLDLTSQRFSEDDLTQTLHVLSRGGSNDTLQSLNLAGTKATSSAIRNLLRSCQSLTHLDLSMCRHLPRGMKRVYRGGPDIQQCLNGLSEETGEEDGGEEVPQGPAEIND
uniref:F-box and leucine rich repeat protein 6 n=2 Tax=Leptobrachium leishanense TaxID=445787 RepID=A0A8C5PJ38_9ANUR